MTSEAMPRFSIAWAKAVLDGVGDEVAAGF
jgi:hypothetical protein